MIPDLVVSSHRFFAFNHEHLKDQFVLCRRKSLDRESYTYSVSEELNRNCTEVLSSSSRPNDTLLTHRCPLGTLDLGQRNKVGLTSKDFRFVDEVDMMR